jgi:myb-like DNA-binding domain
MSPKWSPEEIRIITACVEQNLPYQAITDALNRHNPEVTRTLTGVSQKIFGLRRAGKLEQKPMPRWTRKEEEQLRSLRASNPKMSLAKLAKFFPGRTETSVHHKWYNLVAAQKKQAMAA